LRLFETQKSLIKYLKFKKNDQNSKKVLQMYVSIIEFQICETFFSIRL
jgi:hypothetical protein